MNEITTMGGLTLITYDNKILRQYIDLFKSDEKALAAFWHHGDNQFHMLDYAHEIGDAVQMLTTQGAVFNKIVEKSGFLLINLQRSEGKQQPPVDPLASCLGFCISGFILVVKKECWQCRMPLKDITTCKSCQMECYCNNKSCIPKSGFCFITNK